MPRVWIFKERARNQSDEALDFCKKCWPPTEEFIRDFGFDEPWLTFDFDFHDEHPDYDAMGGWQCQKCKRILTSQDN